MKISMIAAIGKNRELGKGNKLLWNIPQDLKAEARHECIEENCSLRDMILRALKQYLVTKKQLMKEGKKGKNK